jgi:hypothetical protein
VNTIQQPRPPHFLSLRELDFALQPRQCPLPL